MNRSLAGSGEGGLYHPTCPGLPLLSRLFTTTYEYFVDPGNKVRTPFTCLLDAAKSVWVLVFPVSIWRQPQTAKRYHARPHCGNCYTVGSAITHVLMTCPICNKRPVKRACPARGDQICAVCCATKRLVEIRCPDDCRYLESAQRHPAAVVRKQIDADVTVLMATVGRLSEQQLQVFFLLQSMVLSYKPEGLARVTDEDVALAAGALAKSLETATKGVIFEETTGSVVAEGLRRALKPVIDEVTKGGGSRAEREVAIVLRGMERGAKHEGKMIPEGDSSYLDLVARVFQQQPQGKGPEKPLIVMP